MRVLELKCLLAVSWHFSIANALDFSRLGKSPSASRTGRLLKVLGAWIWRCISPCARLPFSFVWPLEFDSSSCRDWQLGSLPYLGGGENVLASSFIAKALDLLPMKTKRLGLCSSGSGRSSRRVWSRSVFCRKMSSSFVAKPSHCVCLQYLILRKLYKIDKPIKKIK